MSVKIVDNRTQEQRAQAVPKRSREAHAALAKSNLPESADADAFMAVYDAAQEAAREGTLHLGDGAVGVVSRGPVAGRDDLELVKGRGAGGCSYIMCVRKRPQPQPVRVEERSWADEEETIELEERERQIVGVRRQP